MPASSTRTHVHASTPPSASRGLGVSPPPPRDRYSQGLPHCVYIIFMHAHKNGSGSVPIAFRGLLHVYGNPVTDLQLTAAWEQIRSSCHKLFRSLPREVVVAATVVGSLPTRPCALAMDAWRRSHKLPHFYPKLPAVTSSGLVEQLGSTFSSSGAASSLRKSRFNQQVSVQSSQSLSLEQVRIPEQSQAHGVRPVLYHMRRVSNSSRIDT